MTDCVLVVDDDQEIRETLIDLMEERGCHAVGAENGEQAIAALEEQPGGRRTCLILLDMMMPVMDGVTFRREQLKRKHLAAIPVAVISADPRVLDQPVDAVEILMKPLQLADVMRLAKRFCECDARLA